MTTQKQPMPAAQPSPIARPTGLQALARENAALREEIAILRASTSWRLTAPLRAIAARLRRTPDTAQNDGTAAHRPHRSAPGARPLETAGAYWDAQQAELAARPPRTAWWTDPPTLRHVNRIVCGDPIDGPHAGFERRVAERLAAQNLTAPKSLSVGCGDGAKERALLKHSIAGTFDCFEAGPGLVEAGRRAAAAEGLSDRIRFHHADAFATVTAADYGLVHWNNALHHMPDTAAAIAWSRDRLQHGGLFAMDDYVGANRFQHSPAIMYTANRMRGLLPDRLLRPHGDPNGHVHREIHLIDPDALAAADPSEATDSANILPALRQTFPNAELIPTGGVFYFLGLVDAFHNFTSEDDLRLLDALLLTDETLARTGETLYAVGLAIRA